MYYMAYSPLFEEVKEGDEIPCYEFMFHRDDSPETGDPIITFTASQIDYRYPEYGL